MERASRGKVTVHTRLRLDDQARELLDRFASRFGRDLRRLLVCLSKGVRLSKAKIQFIKEGLSARHFNSIAAELRGILQSRKKSFEREIQSKTRRARAIKKRLARGSSRGGYSPRAAHQKKRVLGRLQEFLKRAPHLKPPVIFGGRKLWKAQHHLKENGYGSHAEWLKAWREARVGEFFLVGSKDETCGNQSCHFDPHEKTLRVRLPDALGGPLEIPGVSFPYGQEVLERALKESLAISYRFVRKKKGWYVMATTQATVGKICTNLAWGALGVDVGPDRVGAVETDRAGNPIVRKTFSLRLYHQTKDQARARIGDVAASIGAWAVRSGKPVLLEKLDFEGKKAELRERGKGYSRMLSSFAYGALLEAIRSRCAKMGVETILLNPNTRRIGGM